MENNLHNLFEEYINECQYGKRLRSQTIVGYRAAFKLLQKLVPEVVTVHDLNTGLLTEFFKRLQTRERVVSNGKRSIGVKDSTAHTYWSKLNSFFEWLYSRGHLKGKNPLNQIKQPVPEYTDKRNLDLSEVDRIIAAIMSYSNSIFLQKRDLAMMYTLLLAGIRKGELIGLQVRDIDLEKRIMTVRAETSKSRSSRNLPINPTLLMHLKEYLIERKGTGYKTEYLWVNNQKDSGLTEHGLKHWVNRLKNVSGIKFHLHRFRHTFACNLANNNVNLVKIQKCLGHKSPKMTATYLRSIDSEDLREDIDNLSVGSFI